MDRKSQSVEAMLSRLKEIMEKGIRKGREQKALAAIAAGCQILYEYNQRYTDEDFENGILRLAEGLRQRHGEELEKYRSNPNTVLFYDGFGLDTRGVAKMYLNALKKNGYHIVYVTAEGSRGNMPETEEILRDADAERRYINFRYDYPGWAEALLKAALETGPKAMIFYTTPFDASGAAAFAAMEGKADRYLIDLTDHAFWLGVKCNDYFCGSREMSASNQRYERGIPGEKLIKLGVNVMVDEGGPDHSGLPFDPLKTRYIFSGGALYKTLGDERHDYYRMVDHLLENHPDVYFLYAGEGDRSRMDTILSKYPERAFLIRERKDFYYLIKHCTLYLNTYPMFGGMMMKYAALAGRIPVTLRHENDADGLLLDQHARRIEYDTAEELMADADRLLDDPEYLKKREALLEGSVITEERFVRNVRSAIEEHTTDYAHGTEHIDTSRFKKEYFDRFSMPVMKEKLSTVLNLPLVAEFPWIGINLGKIAFRTALGKK